MAKRTTPAEQAPFGANPRAVPGNNNPPTQREILTERHAEIEAALDKWAKATEGRETLSGVVAKKQVKSNIRKR